jgi:hypothetical protein
VHAGGSITVVEPAVAGTPDSFELASWLAVQPGDDLALDVPASHAPITVTVTAPLSTIPGVKSYRVEAPCGGTGFFLGGQSGTMSLDSRCTGNPQTADFTVFAQAANEQDVATFAMSGVAVADGQTVALTGDYQPLVDVPITYANGAGSASSALTVAASAPSSHGLMSEGNATLYASSGLTGTIAWPSQLDSGTRVIQSYPGDNRAILSWQPVASTIALDISQQTGQAITSYPALDVASQTISWTQSADGVPAEMAVVSLAISAGNQYTNWTVVSPGASPQLALPALPITGPSTQLADTSDVGIGVTLLRTPAGAAYRTDVLGAGGFTEGFSGLVAGSASGSVLEVLQPSVPL